MNGLIAHLTSSHTDIIGKRARLVASGILAAQNGLIQNLESRRLTVETELAELTDLAPVQTTQLTVGHTDFRPGVFVHKIQEKQTALHELDIQLGIARATLKGWTDEATPETQEVAE